jgi:phospholipid transport system substrate-binding protein
MVPFVSRAAAFLLAALALPAAAPAAPAPPGPGATPLAVIRASNDAVLRLLAGHDTVDAALEGKLFAVIDPVTDFDRIAAAVVDPFCPKLSAEQCGRFKETFTRLLRVSSIKKLGRYRADAFDYGAEQVAGESATVSTVAHYKDERIPLDYELARRGGAWVIVNYVVDDIDTIRNYRKQFTRLLAQETFDQLIARLRAKIAEYEAEK